MAPELLPVDCNELEEYLPSKETVKALNQAVTDPVKLLDGVSREDLDEVGEEFEVGFERIPDGATPELEISSEEDYYQLREEGQLEILLQEIMPRECRADSDGVRLTAVLMSRIAKNQIFGEGNKRTSYLAGVLFLRNIEEANGYRQILIPDLNPDLTELLSDVAIENTGQDNGKSSSTTEDLDSYLRKGLKKYLTG